MTHEERNSLLGTITSSYAGAVRSAGINNNNHGDYIYHPPVHYVRHEPEQFFFHWTSRLLRNDPVTIPLVRRPQEPSVQFQIVVLPRRGRLHTVMTMDLVGLALSLELGRGLEYVGTKRPSGLRRGLSHSATDRCSG